MLELPAFSTVNEVAARTRLSRASVHRAIRLGRLRAIRPDGIRRLLLMGSSLPCGKYRGIPLEAVPQHYLLWLLRIDLYPRTRALVEAELDARARATGPRGQLSHLVEPGEVAVARQLVEAGRRSLARVHHPDRGGRTEEMQRVNAVADRLLEVLVENNS